MTSFKEKFRSICLEYLPHFQQLSLPEEIDINKCYEAVFIEFRVFPHTEVLIRNAMLKLGSQWSFTIVCGQKNVQFYTDMITRIQRNIKLIPLEVTNMSINEYNTLLLSPSFWELFVGSKILLYQEDSYLFHSNFMDEFLSYDYVGAPWRSFPTFCTVGNGGFSLRSKYVMLEILTRYRNLRFELPASVVNDMRRKRIRMIPEDVFFARLMKLYRIGKVPPPEKAIEFSSESHTSRVLPMGGHQFWYAFPNWVEVLKKNLFLTIKNNATRTEN